MLNAVFRQYWNDPYLTWNPEEYDNMTEINLSPDQVWVPDIVFYDK